MGRAFQFRLKPVQELRGRELEAVQMRFSAQQHRVMHLKNLVQEAQQQIKAAMQPLTVTGEVDPVVSQQQFRYVQYLREQALHLQTRIRQEERVLDLIREELRQAHVKKKSLDQLEENQSTRHRLKLAQHEEAEMEDLVIARGQKYLL